MKTYDCKVQLNGSRNNAVRKRGVTAAEIAILRHIHGTSPNGAAAVVDIKPAGNVSRTETIERARLANRYSHGEMRGPALVKDVLGVAGVPLPQYVPGVDDPEDDGAMAEAAPEPVAPKPPKRTKIAKVEQEEAATAA